MKKLHFIAVCFSIQGLTSAQLSPPPLLFAEMDGQHLLDDGTLLPFWGYGLYANDYMTLPAPLLTYDAGTDQNISFINASPEGHTIHLHGLDVSQSNDGVPSTSITVMPNQQASYSFSADHPGTFLYHCHVTTTLHLTMGMYGMILVKHPNGILWEGGPSYDRDITLLFSDLQKSVNFAPTAAYPFHTIRPDYFMVNGLSGGSLTSNAEVAAAVPGEKVALRLGTMAYSKIQCHFPSSWNAELLMSDGRPLPEATAIESLELYPGERYTVLIDAPEDPATTLNVEFYSMVNGALESTQAVTLNTTLTDVLGLQKPFVVQCFPNPATDELFINLPEGAWTIFNALGQIQASGTHSLTGQRLDVAAWPRGAYWLRHESGSTKSFLLQ